MKNLIAVAYCFIVLMWGCEDGSKGSIYSEQRDTMHTLDEWASLNEEPGVEALRVKPGDWTVGTVAELGTDYARFLSQNTDSLAERTFNMDSVETYLRERLDTITGLSIHGVTDGSLILKASSQTAITIEQLDAGFGDLSIKKGLGEILNYSVLSGWNFIEEVEIIPGSAGQTPLIITGNGSLNDDVMIHIDNISAIAAETYIRIEDGNDNVFDIGSDGTTFTMTVGDRINWAGIGLVQGTGSPEGVITAPMGSFYLNKSGGLSTTLYVKESGAGNTGWIAK